jgi:hypothetical protein
VVRPLDPEARPRLFLVVQVPRDRTWRRNTATVARKLLALLRPLLGPQEEGFHTSPHRRTLMSTTSLRPEIGDFSSIVCFKAVVVGMEDALGNMAAAISLKAAGRMRGAAVATALGFGTTETSLPEAQEALDKALGVRGTRLCAVDRIEQAAGADGADVYRVYLRETICSAGEPQGSARELTFTLGAVHGALEVLLRRKLRGKQIGSVLRGQSHDIIEFINR